MKKAKVFQAWHKLDNANDLKKANLTLSDYQVLTLCLKEAFAFGSTYTFQKNVAEWCQKQGMNVSLEGCNYRIELN